ncbi:MAG: hypothetical protein ACSHXH_18930, partial [Marivita sp.]|uniref:hypothetical protein n=1 Tax=Marivita sp. TaxID=2003365 RepID=UPI003EF16D44
DQRQHSHREFVSPYSDAKICCFEGSFKHLVNQGKKPRCCTHKSKQKQAADQVADKAVFNAGIERFEFCPSCAEANFGE